MAWIHNFLTSQACKVIMRKMDQYRSIPKLVEENKNK